jgi:hypothetical protein
LFESYQFLLPNSHPLFSLAHCRDGDVFRFNNWLNSSFCFLTIFSASFSMSLPVFACLHAVFKLTKSRVYVCECLDMFCMWRLPICIRLEMIKYSHYRWGWQCGSLTNLSEYATQSQNAHKLHLQIPWTNIWCTWRLTHKRCKQSFFLLISIC